MAMEITIAVIFLGPWVLGFIGVLLGIRKLVR